MKDKIILVCENCYSRNYVYTVPKKVEKVLSLNKYCSFCKKNTFHNGNR